MELPSSSEHNIRGNSTTRGEMGDITTACMCVFCCKEIISKRTELAAGEDEKGSTSAKLVLQRFFKLFGREIGFEFSSWMGINNRTSSQPSANSVLVTGKLIKSCEDCLQIVRNYCDLYHQLKSVELRLNWQIEKLCQVMRCANLPSPSRLNMFKTSTDETGANEHRADLYKFRSNFKRKCEQYKLKMLPRVQINRRQESPPIVDATGNSLIITPSWFTPSTPFQDVGDQPEDEERGYEYEIDTEDDLPSGMDEEDVSDLPILKCPVVAPLLKQKAIRKMKRPHPSLESTSPVNNPAVVPLISKTQGRRHVILEEDAGAKQGSSRTGLRQVFKCSKCNASFSSVSRLKQHKTTCPDHQENFRKRHHRLVHSRKKKQESAGSEKSESGEVNGTFDPVKCGQYNCTKCIPPKPFMRQAELVNHQQYMHSNGKAALKWNVICKKVSIMDLKLEGFPSTSRHHPCPKPKCGKSFSHEGELEGHILLDHNNSGDPYVCQACKVFNTCSALKLIEHELEHTNDQQKEMEKEEFRQGQKFVCARCHVVTAAKQDVINHYLEAHFTLGPMMVTCPICQKMFHGLEKVPLGHYVNHHDLRRLDDPDNPFRCKNSQCSAYFLTEEQLHLHWNRVHPFMDSLEDTISRMEVATKEKEARKRQKERYEQRRKCPQCPKTFLQPHQLKAHMWAHEPRATTDKNRWNYNRRSNMVISFPEDGLTIHDLVNDTKLKYRCEVADCGKGFMEEADLATHSKLHGEFQCGICPEVKSFATELALHETVHKVGSKAFCCSRCDFGVGKRGLYLEHFLEKHLGLVGDKQRCPICRMLYRYAVGVADHVKHNYVWKHFMEYHQVETNGSDQHSGETEKLHKCEREDCRAYFLKPSQVREHVLEVHENVSWKKQKEDTYKCGDCGKQFPNQQRLSAHRRSIHKLSEENFEFICTVAGCGQRFEREVQLERHTNYTHSYSQQLECTVDNCGKMFWTKSGLRTHQRYVHEGKTMPVRRSTSEVCEECGKWFPSVHLLNVHKKIHTDRSTWKFECSVCHRKIISGTKLRQHMRVHTKEKRFVCEICGAAYRHMENLRNHRNGIHGLPDKVRRPVKRNKARTPSSQKGRK